MKYELLNKLVEEYGENLIIELANLIDTNGTGDCYGCVCSKYCYKNKCIEAIRLAVKEILKEGE